MGCLYRTVKQIGMENAATNIDIKNNKILLGGLLKEFEILLFATNVDINKIEKMCGYITRATNRHIILTNKIATNVEILKERASKT